MDVKSVFFFGDSICLGQYVPPHLTWVNRISEYLWKRRILVQNCSINGDITRNALLRMPHDVQEQDVDVLYVQFGLNDCNCWDTDRGSPRVSSKSFESNMLEIVERARVSGVKIVLLATNHPVSERLPGNYYYNALVRHVVDRSRYPDLEFSTVLVDHESNWQGRGYGVLQDGVHLDERGHAVYYDNVLSCLREVLGEG